MIRLRTLAVAGALLTGCAACTSHTADNNAPDTNASIAPSISVSRTTAPASRSTQVPPAQRFCDTARKIGMTDVAPTHHGDPAHRTTLLNGIDTLAAIAPAQIKHDFATFDRLEHALFGSGGNRANLRRSASDPRTAASLQHVAAYLKQHCAISQVSG